MLELNNVAGDVNLARNKERQFCNIILWTAEAKISLYQSDLKKKMCGEDFYDITYNISCKILGSGEQDCKYLQINKLEQIQMALDH